MFLNMGVYLPDPLEKACQSRVFTSGLSNLTYPYSTMLLPGVSSSDIMLVSQLRQSYCIETMKYAYSAGAFLSFTLNLVSQLRQT